MIQMTFEDFISSGYSFPGTGGTLVLTVSENGSLEEFEFQRRTLNYSIVSVTATENGDDISVMEVIPGEDYYVTFSMGGEDVEITITVGASPYVSDQSEAYVANYVYEYYNGTIYAGQLGNTSLNTYYDHKIYRSGNLVKKMYRSGEMFYLRLNPPTNS